MLKKFFIYCNGRHTAFAGFFAVMGCVLQWYHRLDSTFVAYMTSLMGLVLGHSIQENHFNVSTKVGAGDAKVDVKEDQKISLDK
ncbi:MAG: hypothetical protein ABSE80_13845 [Halobacteriota archaeon]|jgi:hypothetical protein